jgi:hypothetical protein
VCGDKISLVAPGVQKLGRISDLAELQRDRIHAPHRPGGCQVLDVAREAIVQRLGADVTDPLFDGRALQLGYD